MIVPIALWAAGMVTIPAQLLSTSSPEYGIWVLHKLILMKLPEDASPKSTSP